MSTEAGDSDAVRELRLQAASDWFSRHEAGGELSTAELREWDAWSSDPDNNAEYEGFVRTRWRLKSLPRPPLPSARELRASLSREPDWTPMATQTEAFNVGSRRVRSALNFTSSAIAACAAILAMAMVFRYEFVPGSLTLDSGHVYATAAGEQREFVLKDGSVVTLAGDSSLSVNFTLTRRTAVLDHGEARFHVQHDHWRPFTVLAGVGSITAVGTVFDVRRYSNRVLVTVSEGAVEVVPRETSPQDVPQGRQATDDTKQWVPLRVARGEEIAYDAKGEASTARQTDVRLATAWTEGSLAYRGRPLHEVIEDVQRYSTRHIVLDPDVADLQYTGTFVQRNADQWIRGLSRIFPVEIVETAPDRILIRSRLPNLQGTDTDVDAEH
ncbi:MAG: FecR family protein [Steroidobacteraceae bacterium]